MLKSMTTLAIALVMVTAGCTSVPRTEEERSALRENAEATLKRFVAEDPGLDDLLDRSHAYAVFPEVGKGGAIVGGAWGQGAVYENGNFVGYSELTQATVGAQLGGQSFAELIVFETEDALDRFKLGKTAFAANASAVAIKAGASAQARFQDGVAVFTQPNGGLMFEAAIGGQKFTFTAVED